MSYERFWAGVDIGGTKTAVVLSADPPHVLWRAEFPTLPADGPDHAIQQIKLKLHAALKSRGVGAGNLIGIGVSCGSPLDPVAGIIQAPPNLSTWIDVPIVAMLEAEFKCPVSLENDANAGALAEHQYGAGRGTQDMVFLTMGTGLGAGLIIGGRLHRGASNYAGEIGHVRLTRTGPIGYHKAGSVEGWASGGGLAQVARQVLTTARRKGRKSLLFDFPLDHEITAKDVGLAAQRHDAVARSIVRICGHRLGEAMAVLVDILNPERIVIGGLALRLGEMVLEPARESLRREALPPAYEVCTVVPAELGEAIGDAAAICVATQFANGVQSMPLIPSVG
jgi:glucokinase